MHPFFYSKCVKLFFGKVLKTKFDIDKLERPPKVKQLPNVLSKEEVIKILSAPYNSKHRIILSLIYACVLRRSELINLQLKDIEADRLLRRIRQSKGRKDRLVPLPEKLLEQLRWFSPLLIGLITVRFLKYSFYNLLKIISNTISLSRVLKIRAYIKICTLKFRL